MHNKMTYGEKLQQAKDTQGLDFKVPPQVGRMDKERTLEYYTNKLRGYWLNEFETEAGHNHKKIMEILLSSNKVQKIDELIRKTQNEIRIGS